SPPSAPPSPALPPKVIATPPSGNEGQLTVPPSPASEAEPPAPVSGVDDTSLEESGEVTCVPDPPEDPALPAPPPPDPPAPGGGAALSPPEHAARVKRAKQTARVPRIAKGLMPIRKG